VTGGPNLGLVGGRRSNSGIFLCAYSFHTTFSPFWTAAGVLLVSEVVVLRYMTASTFLPTANAPSLDLHSNLLPEACPREIRQRRFRAVLTREDSFFC